MNPLSLLGGGAGGSLQLSDETSNSSEAKGGNFTYAGAFNVGGGSASGSASGGEGGGGGPTLWVVAGLGALAILALIFRK